MKIALAQLNYHIGNFEANEIKIINAINKAKEEKSDLIVFSELAIGGHPTKDLLRNAIFIENCEQSLTRIASYCDTIDCIIGAPIRNKNQAGKALYNSAVVISKCNIKQYRHKTVLTDYDIFDESRYFSANKDISCITLGNKKIALTIGDDLWDDSVHHDFAEDLMQQYSSEKPDFIINISASPFSYLQHNERVEQIKNISKKTSTPVIHVNQIGGHADIIFDGRSLVLNRQGDIVFEMLKFQEDIQYVHYDGDDFQGQKQHSNESEIALIHQALVLGLRDYFYKSGFKKAILGLSGGLDSAIVAALAAEALGAENVLAVLMPSIYSSDHSIKDALDLVANTGCNHITLPIKDITASFEDTLSEAFAGLSPNITEENIQARTRGTLLMALSNKFDHILLNTSNKSESAVGYGTLYGDMAGALSVIGDVYKTQAYELAKYINREREIIPLNTITKPPSAELRPDQKDSDSLPSYDILDAILFLIIEKEKSGQEIISLGFDEELVQRICKLVHQAEFKRYQAAPTLRVSSKAFGPGRQIPLVSKFIF